MSRQSSRSDGPPPSDGDRDAAAVGGQVRRIRERQGVSLRGLARDAGVSPSYLSSIERGDVMPSVKMLRGLAQALSVPLFALLDLDTAGAWVSRAAARPRIRFPASTVEYEPISLSPARKLQVYFGHLQPGAPNTPEPVGHGAASEECLLVMAGSLVVRVAEEEWRLEQGDSLYFDASLPHQLKAVGDVPATFLSATTGVFPGWANGALQLGAGGGTAQPGADSASAGDGPPRKRSRKGRGEVR